MRAAGLAAAVLLFCLGWAQDYPVAFPTLAGGTMGIEELAQGRWALGFVVVPGCPACEKVVPWLAYAAQAFPEIRFLLVAPAATPELAGLAGGLQVYVDRGGAFGTGLGVRRAPTVFLVVAGMPILQLDWPFTEEELRDSLNDLESHEVPDPRALVGQPAAGFSAVDLEGREIPLADLPKPILLVFFNVGCPGCWEDLPALAKLSREVAIALFAFAKRRELAEGDRARLEAFLEGVESQQVAVLLAKTFEILDTYRVARSPTYFLIDRKGVIAWVKEGSEGLVEEVRKQLEVLEEQGGVQCGVQC